MAVGNAVQWPPSRQVAVFASLCGLAALGVLLRSRLDYHSLRTFFQPALSLRGWKVNGPQGGSEVFEPKLEDLETKELQNVAEDQGRKAKGPKLRLGPRWWVNSSCGPVAVTRRTGRLGNRMFYLATALGVGWRSHKPPEVGPSTHGVLRGAFANLSRWAGTSRLLPPLANRPSPSDEPKPLFVPDLKHIGWDRQTDSLPCEREVELGGTRHSWLYFRGWEEEIRQLFLSSWAPAVRRQCDEAWRGLRADAPNGTVFVGVHIRRRDRANMAKRGKGSVVDGAYLERALKEMRRRLEGQRLRFIVLGDDAEWNKENLPKKGLDLVFPKRRPGPVDLCILSRASHSVVTTGTFSWWAGFLAGGLVVRSSTLITRSAQPDTPQERAHDAERYLPGSVLCLVTSGPLDFRRSMGLGSSGQRVSFPPAALPMPRSRPQHPTKEELVLFRGLVRSGGQSVVDKLVQLVLQQCRPNRIRFG